MCLDSLCAMCIPAESKPESRSDTQYQLLKFRTAVNSVWLPFIEMAAILHLKVYQHVADRAVELLCVGTHCSESQELEPDTQWYW